LITLLLAVGLSLAIIVITNQYRAQIQNLGNAGYLGLCVISIIGNAILFFPAPVFILEGAQNAEI
jgi:hypothetical protein